MPSKVEKIVDDMIAKIDQGEWYSGMKLPSQHQLSLFYRVNRSTIVEALARLKARGIIFAHQGRGTFVNQSDIRQEEGVAWKDLSSWSFYPRSKRMVQLINQWENNSNLIQISKGVLSSDLMALDRIQSVIEKLSFPSLNQEYGDGKGDLELRQALSDYLHKKGVQASPEGILIVSGALNGIQLICTGVLQAGSTIYHGPLSYLHTLNVFEALGLKTKISEIPIQAAASNFNKSAHCFYVNPTYANPDGSTLTQYERNVFLGKMIETNTPVIEDDIYSDLYFDKPVKPMKAFDSNGQVLYVGSFSKTLTPALRVGWVVGPSDLIRKLADLRMQTDYGSSIVSQAICKELLLSSEYDAHLIETRSALRKREAYLRTLLDTQLSHLGSYRPPTGGFFIWYTFKETCQLSSRSLALLCRKKGVVINPGFIYGERGSVSIRLSFAYESEENLDKGIGLLRQAVEELMEQKR